VYTPARRPGRGAARAAVGATAVSLAVVAVPAPASAAPTAPYVSEVHYDDTGADSGEFVVLAGGLGDHVLDGDNSDALVGGPGEDVVEGGRQRHAAAGGAGVLRRDPPAPGPVPRLTPSLRGVGRTGSFFCRRAVPSRRPAGATPQRGPR
jgi:hypothetical protein